jgi:hypothetical protein
MADLISILRAMTNCGATDYTVNGVSYWTDAQLQVVLDRYKHEVYQRQLQPISENVAGVLSTTKYKIGDTNIESTGSLTLYDNTYTAVTTGFTVDYAQGLVTFTANTNGARYFVSYRTYDLHAAAADVWYQKAAHASEMIDFSTDGHSIKRAHVATMCMKMAQKYEAMATFSISSPAEIVRGDLA